MTDPLKTAMRKLEAAYSPGALEGAVARTEGNEDPLTAALRAAEALLFASGEALSAEEIAQKLPPDTDIPAVLAHLREAYAGRGVELIEVAGKWRFQTAPDLGHLFAETRAAPKRLSKAALECLAVIAYHQPVTRAEVEEIRGVALSRGTLDFLLELGWVRPRGRRRTPGRPVTYGTTEAFLAQFSLASLDTLPGKEDLLAAGVFDARLPQGFDTPRPSDELTEGEDPLGEGESPDFFVDHLGEGEE
jgi:segregation and condensation protein B